MRRLVVLTALLALPVLPIAAGAAPAGNSGNFPARIDLPNAFAPEGIESGPGTSAFVGSLVDGAIWRGDLRTGSGAVFAAGAPGRASVGMAYEAEHNRLWVAGGGPMAAGQGDVRVYDAASGELLMSYTAGDVGFLNDVTITPDAVYVTDSGTPAQLVVIPLSANGSLPPAATTLLLTGDLVATPDAFNLNGIVSRNGIPLVVQSSTGMLFRVDPATGATTAVDLGGAVVGAGAADGMELRGSTLYVVRNSENLVTVVRIKGSMTSGSVLGDISDPDLDVPTTATLSAGRLWAVNARFGTPVEPDTPYWITQLSRRP